MGVNNMIDVPRRADQQSNRELPTVPGLKNAFSSFPSGVVALCGMVEGELVGMSASSFTAVSLDPPLVSVCVDLRSTTWPRLRTATALGVSILSEDQGALCRQLSSKSLDRFDGVGLSVSDEGAVFIDDAATTFECTIDSEVLAGDHLIILLAIQALETRLDQVPLVYHSAAFKSLSQRS